MSSNSNSGSNRKNSNTKKNAAPTSTGNSSTNPGVWLTETIVFGDNGKASTKADSETLASAKIILQSYCGWRHTDTCAQEPEEAFKFDHELQNRTLLTCAPLRAAIAAEYEARTAAAKDKDAAYELEEQLKYDDLDAEKGVQTDIEEYARKRKDAPAPDASEGYSAPISTGKVTDEQLTAQYAKWHADPSQENETSFFDTLGAFITEQARMAYYADSYSKWGEAEDIGQTLCLEMMTLLKKKQAAGEIVKDLHRYVRRSWKRSGCDRNRQIQRHNRLFMATEGEGYTDYNGDTGEWDQLDVHVDQEWERAQKAKSPQFALQTRLENETTEDRLERYTAILPTLDPKHQEVAELWMNGHTENQIAEQLEMSPQKVVRTKVKIRGAMAAGAAINSGKGVVA
jgi:hypothetical protein